MKNKKNTISFVGLKRQFISLQKELEKSFIKIGSSGTYVFGKDLQNFENIFSKYCNTKYAVGLNSGSDALFLSLKALGIGNGDEVITAANSFIASAWTIAATGAKPVYVDVLENFNINYNLIEQKITKKTKAIMPVHLTGRVSDMDKIKKISLKYKIPIIEDSAQAVGATYKNKKAGSFGLTGCFSLHPLKTLGVYGDGGILTTNSKVVRDKILRLRNHGLINRDECQEWGYNSRLDNLQASFALIKMKKIDQWNHKNRWIAKQYKNELGNFVKVPNDNKWEKPIYHNFIIQVKNRSKLINYLNNQKIETRIHYPIPLHLQKCSKNLNYKNGDMPVAEKQSKEILSLPIYPELLDSELEYIIKKIKSYYK